MSLTMESVEVGLDESRMKAAEAITETGTRQLDFYASAFNQNPDKNGDIVDPKAFDAWLPKFYAAGQALPISHNHSAFLDGLDPTNVIGYASPDPEHVWVDDYGLRVSAVLNTKTEKGKAVEWQIEHGLLKGASFVGAFSPENVTRTKTRTIMKSIDRVLEAGLVPNPANTSAVLLWMKSEHMTEETNVEQPYITVSEFEEVLKSSPTNIQEWHDALTAQGAECAIEVHQEVDAPAVIQKDEEEPEDVSFLTHLRLIEASVPRRPKFDS